MSYFLEDLVLAGKYNTTNYKLCKDLFQTTQKDLDALRIQLKFSGISDADIEKSYELVHEKNRNKGLY